MACRFLEIIKNENSFFCGATRQEVSPICQIKREYKGAIFSDMQEALRQLGVNYLPNNECQFYNLNEMGMCPKNK